MFFLYQFVLVCFVSRLFNAGFGITLVDEHPILTGMQYDKYDKNLQIDKVDSMEEGQHR